MIRERVWEELQRQPRWFLWAMLVSMAYTFASTLGGDPRHRFGGPVWYFVVLIGSGVWLVLLIVVLKLRGRTGAGGR